MQRQNSNRDLSKGQIKICLETENIGVITFEFKRSALESQMSESQKKSLQDTYQVPLKCASPEVITIFNKYLSTKNIAIYKEKHKEIDLLIGTLRFADFIGLNTFQESFISQIVVSSINVTNCIPFLQETHKKLKNQENGSQCWYSLLNACISYIAQNLGEVYSRSQQKIKGLHEKILNQILDRAIRNGSKDEQKIFELIMKSRKVTTVHSLCEVLRKSIMTKKINSKIHAKLSWKLQDVLNINQKKTKNFKFLQYQWMLSANRLKNNELQVSLLFCGIEKKEIGSFYIKLIWWVDGQTEEKKEEEMTINYLLMNMKHELKVLTLTENMQRQLGKSKIELSIFCCMDQIYTFTLNYITKYSQKINIEQRQLTAEELEILAWMFKERKDYVSSVRYLKYLSNMSQNLPMDLISSFPINELNTNEFDFIQKARGVSQKSVVQSQTSSRPSQPSEVASQNLSVYSRKSQQRPESRGRLRKIFASSPSKGPQPSLVRMQDINRITNIKNYFFDKNNPLMYQL